MFVIIGYTSNEINLLLNIRQQVVPLNIVDERSVLLETQRRMFLTSVYFMHSGQAAYTNE